MSLACVADECPKLSVSAETWLEWAELKTVGARRDLAGMGLKLCNMSSSKLSVSDETWLDWAASKLSVSYGDPAGMGTPSSQEGVCGWRREPPVRGTGYEPVVVFPLQSQEFSVVVSPHQGRCQARWHIESFPIEEMLCLRFLSLVCRPSDLLFLIYFSL